MIKKILNESSIWYQGIKLVEDYKNRFVSKIKDQNFIVIGMRRFGKTQLLKQLAKEYKENEDLFIDIHNPIYDDIGFGVMGDKTQEFTMSIIKIIRDNKIKIVLFDEIQSLVNWSKLLKGIIDILPDVRFIATGSDAHNLNKSSEFGIGRFNIYFIGAYSIEEFRGGNDDVEEYIENHSFPQIDTNELTLTEKYSEIIGKQITVSKMNDLNIKNILRAIALNPGHKMTLNKISNLVKEISDSKISSDQVKTALEFLINSELIISVIDKPSSERTSKLNQYTLYSTDWNSYKYYTSLKYINLTNETIPKRGFVFENMVISNIFSKLNTHYTRSKIFNKVSKPDLDIIINDIGYEIKSFDYLEIDVRQQMEIIKKVKELDSVVIHTGKTFKEHDVKFINWIEFIKSI